jgi:hypothetical protein
MYSAGAIRNNAFASTSSDATSDRYPPILEPTSAKSSSSPTNTSEEAFDAQVGTHRVHVVDAIDGAAHVFNHGGEELYLGAPGAVCK